MSPEELNKLADKLDPRPPGGSITTASVLPAGTRVSAALERMEFTEEQKQSVLKEAIVDGAMKVIASIRQAKLKKKTG